MTRRPASHTGDRSVRSADLGRSKASGCSSRRTHAPRDTTFASPTVEMLFRLMEQPGPHAVRFSIFGGYDDRPRQGQRCTMPVAPSPDEQRMTPGSKWTKGQRIPKFRRVETFLWRCLIDSSISIVGHPYPLLPTTGRPCCLGRFEQRRDGDCARSSAICERTSACC